MQGNRHFITKIKSVVAHGPGTRLTAVDADYRLAYYTVKPGVYRSCTAAHTWAVWLYFYFFCVAWRSTSPVNPTPSLKKLHFMYIAYSVLVLLFSSFISGKKKLQYFSTNKHHLHFLKNLSLLFHAPRVHPQFPIAWIKAEFLSLVSTYKHIV